MVLEIDRENNMKPSAIMRSVAAQKRLALFAFALCIALARGIDLGQCAEREEAASSANSAEGRIDGVALFLKWASGSAFPKEGFIRYAIRYYQDVKINPSNPMGIEFVQREDGGFSEQIYESAWQGENFYWKETTDSSVPFSTDSCSGKSENLYWSAANKQLEFYTAEIDSNNGNFDNDTKVHSFQNHVKASFEIIKEILTLKINGDENMRFRIDGERLLVDENQNTVPGYGVFKFAKDGSIKSLIVHDESSQMKQRYIYRDWTKFSDLGLFPQIIGISAPLPIDAPDKFELVSEINLLEFVPKAPENAVNPFHYSAHIQEDTFEKYVHIGDIEYHLSGTNLVPVITMPPARSWNAVVMAIFLLGIVASLFYGIQKERKNFLNKNNG